MKRLFGAIICIVFLLVSVPETPIAAATPTPTRAVTPAPSGKPVDAGILNTMLDNSDSYSFGASETAKKMNVPSVNLEAGKDFNIANLDTIAALFKRAAPFLTAFTVKKQTVVQDPNLFISGKAITCQYSQKDGSLEKQEVSKLPYKTEVLPELSDLDQASRQIAPLLTRYSISKTNDQYDFRRDALEIQNPPECDTTGQGTTQDEKAVQITQPMTVAGWLVNLFKEIFASGTIKKTFSSKQLTPYADSMNCLIVGCKGDENLTYLPEEERERVSQGGGIAKTYAPITHDVTKGETHGEQDNAFGGTTTIKTHTAYTKAVENATNYIKCAILPKSAQAKYGLTNECQRAPVAKDTCETAPLPNLPINPECKLKNNTLKLPANLTTAIEAASSAFKVPSSLMVGIMFSEGAFNKADSIYLNSTEVEKYLKGCAILPNCDPNSTKEFKNIVPYIPVDWPSIADAVKVVDPNRTPNPCNLLDGIFALAKDLSKNQYGVPRFAGKSCFGIPLNAGSGASFTCNWSDSSAETAIRVWEFGTAWIDATKSCATKRNSCSEGGGFLMQCQTGGDTCETVNNRYTQKSHNACIWDVYKSN
ncbi:MAG: hypothetical protein V1917_04420 [Candidatus Gottesmanbacteria bacterium]